MRKTIKKKAVIPKKKNGIAVKKNLRPVKIKSPETPKKLVYPSWTTPKHLSEKDRKDLKRFYELFISGKVISAFAFASNFDTIVREAIPLEIWKQSGGKLTKAGEEELKKAVEKGKKAPVVPVRSEKGEMTVKEEKTQQKPKKEAAADLNAGSDEHSEPVEIKFQSGKELEELVLENSKTFFGENVLLFKNKNEARDERYPDKFLIDFSNAEKPRLYLVEVILPDESFGQYFVRITHFLALLRNKRNHEELMWKLYNIVNSDEKRKKELQALMQEYVEIPEFLSTSLENKSLVLLITGGEKSELSLLTETYVETWGKMLKTLIIRKYSDEGKITYPTSPAFADLLKNDKGKPEVIRCTEADHLLAVSETIRSIYTEIKTALLKADDSIKFNVKKIYISVRKNKNLAFFHLRKRISLVVMNPEDDTRKQIKHHEIKSLPASVQKFWNGPSCTIIIENSVNLAEVINLLKKMIAKA